MIYKFYEPIVPKALNIVLFKCTLNTTTIKLYIFTYLIHKLLPLLDVKCQPKF